MTVFKEEQRFTQWWLWLLMIGIGLFQIYWIITQLILGQPVGDNPAPDTVLVVISILVFGVIGLVWFIKLKTEIDRNEIRVRFIPFVKRIVRWNEVKTAEVINYGFQGGWGIRVGTKYGTVYNTKGKIGLAIELHNGKKFLVGTQKEKELAEVIRKFVS